MAKTMKRPFRWLLLAGSLLLVNIARADEVPPPAYQLAASGAGIPSEVLYAVALTESGLRIDGRIRPWPWTLNVAGKGRFFKSREDACIALNRVLKSVSAKRVDVGLGQINVGYHGQKVNHHCDLLDPYLNLSIAADILKSHHRSGNDWLIAIGRYHRPAGGGPAKRYRNVASKHLARITAEPTNTQTRSK